MDKRVVAAFEAFEEHFGYMPLFIGLDEHIMTSDEFLTRLERAVEIGNDNIDLSPWFPDGVII